MSGTRPSDGWVHALLSRAAAAVAAANKVIRGLILLAQVICGDETPIRSRPGPKAKKKYLHVACTTLLTYYFPGERNLPSFKDFIYTELSGTVVVLTGTRTTTTSPASATNCAQLTCSGTWKTPPSPTPAPSGPPRSPRRCAA